MNCQTDSLSAKVNAEGFAIIPPIFSVDEIDAISVAVLAPRDKAESSAAHRTRAGERDVLGRSGPLRELSSSSKLISLAESVIGAGAFPVRGLLFDKTPTANWLVPWHQDLTICVADRVDIAGYGPWSVKGGIHHVQPPMSVLDSMVAIRLHLDTCDDTNGPLRVLPGTHRYGRLSAVEIAYAKAAITAADSPVERGGILLMKPLLLHASSPGTKPAQRRVLHIEYANCTLPGGLEWIAQQQPEPIL